MKLDRRTEFFSRAIVYTKLKMAFTKRYSTRRRPMTARRGTTLRRTTGYKSIPRAPRSDGQKILVNGYCEISKSLAAEEGVLSYSIACDPKTCGVTLVGDASALDGAAPPAPLTNNMVNLPKWNTMKQLFHQYRIDSVTITVRVDSTSGLENRLIICNDKGDSTIVSSMQMALSGAHKEYSMTQSNRQAKYTYTCKGQDRDWFSTKDNQNLTPSEVIYLKVFQKLAAGAATTIAEHQVSIMFNLALKDTQNLN